MQRNNTLNVLLSSTPSHRSSGSHVIFPLSCDSKSDQDIFGYLNPMSGIVNGEGRSFYKPEKTLKSEKNMDSFKKSTLNTPKMIKRVPIGVKIGPP